MAVSGGQFTRIGAHMSGTAIKLTILAKAQGVVADIGPDSLTRSLLRGLTRSLTRGITDRPENC